MSKRIFRTTLLVFLAGLAAFATAPAQGHIQVQPSEVAPGDPVLFTVLVPGETESGTVKVQLKVPDGVFPFSFEEVPGWKRKLVKKSNGLVDQIVWSGKTAPDGLLRFSFLAGTPEKSGSIRWPAIQTYSSGEEARWIGDAKSENPAPVTLVSDSVPSQNAGGEGRADNGDEAPGNDPLPAGSSEDSTNWPVTVAALLGFFFGLSSLVILLARNRGLDGGR